MTLTKVLMMELGRAELKDFLDAKVIQYNTIAFIEDDPISIPHRYILKQDIEISGFLVASIAWGNRKMITSNGHRMMDILGDSPFDFVMNHQECHLDALAGFVHRTFNSGDFIYFIKALQHIYKNREGLEGIFNKYQTEDSLQAAIHQLHTIFFEIPHLDRTRKHVADPNKGSAAKKINMFLRWMIRNDDKGVDFGLWKSINPAHLMCPLDVHSGRIARKLGLLYRKQDDWKAVEELTTNLRVLDAQDPVKYDFALFGLGIYENF